MKFPQGVPYIEHKHELTDLEVLRFIDQLVAILSPGQALSEVSSLTFG